MDFELTPLTPKDSPLPLTFVTVNPANSNEEHSNVKMGEADVHASGITFKSNPNTTDSNQLGLIVVTR